MFPSCGATSASSLCPTGVDVVGFCDCTTLPKNTSAGNRSHHLEASSVLSDFPESDGHQRDPSQQNVRVNTESRHRRQTGCLLPPYQAINTKSTPCVRAQWDPVRPQDGHGRRTLSSALILTVNACCSTPDAEGFPARSSDITLVSCFPKGGGVRRETVRICWSLKCFYLLRSEENGVNVSCHSEALSVLASDSFRMHENERLRVCV